MFQPVHNAVDTEGMFLDKIGTGAKSLYGSTKSTIKKWPFSPGYVVSALMHKDVSDLYSSPWDTGMAVADLVLHLALWTFALILEIAFRAKVPKTDRFEELAALSMWTLILALTGIALSVVFNVVSKFTLPFGGLYPFVTVAIEGGALVSAIASGTYYLIAMLEYSNNADGVGSGNATEGLSAFATETGTDALRPSLIYLVALKLLAVYMVKTNGKFLPASEKTFAVPTGVPVPKG